jgi:hypothetical protein
LGRGEEGLEIPVVFGVVTSGTQWRFMQLEGKIITLGLFPATDREKPGDAAVDDASVAQHPKVLKVLS